jgi:hypothetical protein
MTEPTEGEIVSAFETLTQEEWVEQGAGGGAAKGAYRALLEEFVGSGARYARINTDPKSGGPYAGKKAASISTSLKGAQNAKDAPGSFEAIKVSSRGGIVYLENTAA